MRWVKIGRGGQTGAYVCPLERFLLTFLLHLVKIINELSLLDIVQKLTSQTEYYVLLYVYGLVQSGPFN